MQTIISSNGYLIKVSDEDYDYLNQFSWYVNAWGYAARTKRFNGKQTTVLMHKEIAARMGLNIDGIIDHKDNSDTLNNQRDNLRESNPSLNSANRRMQSNNTNGFIGVTRCRNKWKARCGDIYGGVFLTAIEAAKVHDRIARNMYGEHTNLNFPNEDIDSMIES